MFALSSKIIYVPHPTILFSYLLLFIKILHLNFNKPLLWNIVGIEDSPLNDTWDQIRLLTILPEVDLSNPVHSTMQIVSLQDLTPYYQKFLSRVGQVASKGQLLSRWPRSRNLLFLTNTKNQDLHDAYRYTRGDFTALSYISLGSHEPYGQSIC